MNDKKEKLSPNFAWQGFSCNVTQMNLNKTDFVKAHKGNVPVDVGVLYDKVMSHKNAYDKQEGIVREGK